MSQRPLLPMEPIERTTIAQRFLCRRQFAGTWCPVCQSHKSPKIPFCKACYFHLPEHLRHGLYIGPAPETHEQWCENYIRAKDYLRSQRVESGDDAPIFA